MRHWIWLGVMGCAMGLPRDLGDVVGDEVRLQEVDALRHLHDASTRSDAIVKDAFRGSTLRMQEAPDPSAYLEALAAEHSGLPALQETVPLTVLTYNVALLRRTYLGVLVESPHMDARRDVLGEVFDLGYDVLLLQEVWNDEDVETLQAAARARGYVTWSGTPRLHENHGLMMAARATVVTGEVAVDEGVYRSQRKLEYWPGPNVRRGWLSMSFQLAGTSQRLTFYDTHATSFPEFWKVRNGQARELGRISRDAQGVVILGGDLNSGPYYPNDQWLDGSGSVVRDWWANATAWGLWQHYGDLKDMAALSGQADDIRWMRSVPDDWTGYLREPYGDASWCEGASKSLISGSDCNSLYHEQYAGTEYPSRLDHLMLRDAASHVRVTSVEMILQDRTVPVGEQKVELSDHYGVVANLLVDAS